MIGQQLVLQHRIDLKLIGHETIRPEMIWHEIIRQATNHLWQSTLFALAAALLTLAFRRNRAHVRYCLWLSASMKFLLPFTLLISLGNNLWTTLATRPVATRLTPPTLSHAVQQITQPLSANLPHVSSTPLTHTAGWTQIALLTLWFCGFLAIACMRLRNWLHIRTILRASKPINLQIDIDLAFQHDAKPVTIRSSPASLEPGVVGIFHPVLLLPQEILQHLPKPQLEAVIAHELTHIRRRDNFTAAIHMLVEALFWFYPLVWWIGARLVEERERACDEAVLTLGNEPDEYANAILTVCKLYVESPLTCVSGISGSDLKRRILRIMTHRVGVSMSHTKKLLLASFAFVATVLPIAAGWAQVGAGMVALMHPKDGVRRAFEVATIKPSPETAEGTAMMIDPAHYRATNISVIEMIRYAYGIKSDDQLLGAPGWLKTEHLDIEGKASDADAKAFDKLGFEDRLNEPRLLVQSLLEDRFHLKAKIETRDLPVYALVVDKGGIKMQERKELPPPAGAKQHPAGDLPMPPPPPPPPPPAFGEGPGLGPIIGRGLPMSQFTELLSRSYELGDRSVVDQTGLTGKYDFVLNGVSLAPPAVRDASLSGTQAHEVSLFTALRDQLGLKLVPTKAMVEVLIIDHIEQPSPN